jgi:acylphosphatase
MIHGKVQGVGFRWWTRSLAARLGLSGTVRNLEDGTVEVRAAGEPEALRRLAEALARGPSAARVERVQEDDWAGAPEPGEFRITH